MRCVVIPVLASPIRGCIEPGDVVVVVFSYGAEVTTLEIIEEACSDRPGAFRRFGSQAWFGGTHLDALNKLLEELRPGGVVVISDGYFCRDDRLPECKRVDIEKLPEVVPFEDMYNGLRQ